MTVYGVFDMGATHHWSPLKVEDDALAISWTPLCVIIWTSPLLYGFTDPWIYTFTDWLIFKGPGALSNSFCYYIIYISNYRIYKLVYK